MNEKISICWLRRDLRLHDNAALYHALRSGNPVLCLFIFDSSILESLSDRKDRRVNFIYERLKALEKELNRFHSSLLILHDTPAGAFETLCERYTVESVFANHDYEPYARERDQQIGRYLGNRGILFSTFKDQVLFEKSEILNGQGNPYTVFTAYVRTWKHRLELEGIQHFPSEAHLRSLVELSPFPFPVLEDIGFKKEKSGIGSPLLEPERLEFYQEERNFPGKDSTSKIGVHLRFGTISVREMVRIASSHSETWLNELVWREFFMMILYHFPEVTRQSFKPKYDQIGWLNDENNFERWCKGETGYPLVDAGMRQLNQTGWMHNRVRMLTASFLCKHLLIDWRWGEAYFAQKLIDYELASNNGNWQWVAGSGCDSAPYFRIFNPDIQLKKFDPELIYVRRWIENYASDYMPKMIEHDYARKRALRVYEAAL